MNSKYDNDPLAPEVVHEGAVMYGYATPHLYLAHQSRLGIRRKDLMSFAKRINRTLLELSEILPASYSTLTKKDRFDRATSVHILQLKRLYDKGIEVFGDVSLFNTWLDESVSVYDGASSFSMLDTSFGIQLVTDAIVKIDHGLPV